MIEKPMEQFEAALAARMPFLLDEVRGLLADDWPDYARFLARDHGEVAYAGTVFVQRLVGMAQLGLADPDPPPSEAEAEAKVVFEKIGRLQFQHGLDLSALLGAYQVGARAAWRHVSATALELDLKPRVLATLADAVFGFVDQFSAASAHGYVLEQSESSAARERSRDELSQLLLSGRSDDVEIRAAAERAEWLLPMEAAVVLVVPENFGARDVLDHLDPACLPIRRPGVYGVIVPDPTAPTHMDRLADMLWGAGAVVGNPVPLTTLPASMRIAQIALELRGRGLIDGDPVFASEHLDTIIVNRDERLFKVLRSQVLRPLEQLPTATRSRLAETLASWLRNMGDRQAVARELHIHPQTVRYRIGQLRDCFGEALDSPHSRVRLFLALIWGPPVE